MKYIPAAVLLLLLATFCPAMSVEEIGRLADLKTNDDLLVQMIQKGGLDQPLTTADVIYLREHGASERVIQYCLKLSDAKKTAPVPSVQEDSEMIAENLRAYTTTTRDGKKVRVVTNLDENGQRMGGPVPPSSPEPPPAPAAPPPQEIRLTVTDDRPEAPRYEEEYEPGYYDPNGVYDGYYPYGSYYPYGGYPFIPPFYGQGGHRPHKPPAWHSGVPLRNVRPPRQQQPARPAPPAASRGVRIR